MDIVKTTHLEQVESIGPIFCLQLVVFGQSGANGLSATLLAPSARSSGLAIVPMLPWLLPVMATQLRRLHVHQVTH